MADTRAFYNADVSPEKNQVSSVSTRFSVSATAVNPSPILAKTQRINQTRLPSLRLLPRASKLNKKRQSNELLLHAPPRARQNDKFPPFNKYSTTLLLRKRPMHFFFTRGLSYNGLVSLPVGAFSGLTSVIKL